MSVASKPSPRMFDTRLPQPSDRFEWVQERGLPALRCAAVETCAHHLFTARNWRLGAHSSEPVANAWDEVAAAMHVTADRLVRVRQVHGAGVVVHRIDDPPRCGVEADILLTDDPTVAIAVQAADC